MRLHESRLLLEHSTVGTILKLDSKSSKPNAKIVWASMILVRREGGSGLAQSKAKEKWLKDS